MTKRLYCTVKDWQNTENSNKFEMISKKAPKSSIRYKFNQGLEFNLSIFNLLIFSILKKD